MGYIAYTDPEFKTPYLINPKAVGDMSVSDGTSWNAYSFYAGETLCHMTPISDIFVSYSAITEEMVMPSVTLYFRQGWSIELTFEKINTYQAELKYYCRITDKDGNKINGLSTTITYQYPQDNPACGFVFVKTNATVAGVVHPCIGIVLGWWTGSDFEGAYLTRVISIEAFEAEQTDPSGGIPISPEGGDGTYTLHAETLGFGTAEGRSDDMGGGGLSAGTDPGTHLYDLDLAAFSDFMGTAYAGTGSLSFADLWQAYKNSMHDPLSGILGALILPIDPPSTGINYVRLSGQSFAVSGNCGYVTKRFGETGDAVVNVVPYYNTFLDYEPFTKITLYLPFVGSVGLNTNECMGGSISVRYWIDYCTGNCVAYVTLTDRAGRPSYYQYSGNCAAFIPVSGHDAGISSIISGAGAVITGTVQSMSGNPAGISSVIGGGLQIAEPKTTQKHVGGFSGGSGCVGCLYPFAVINRPSAATAQGYTGLMGAPSAMSGTVQQYHGYTEFLQVFLDGLDAPQHIKDDIIAKLKGGVII